HIIQAHHQIQESMIAESKKPIKQIYQKYITHCELQKLSKATINGKLNLLSIFQKHEITYIEDLTQEIFNKLIKSWENNKKDTLRKHIANIKAFLNYCIKQKLYSRDDYETLTFPNPKVGVRDLVINEQDYLKLINHCKDNDFTLYLDTLWETGCRPNEITQLKKSDIEFNKGIAKIYQFKTKKYKTAYLTDLLLRKFDKLKLKLDFFNSIFMF
ncbi:MAG: tyrosine-type recombinase/integrase, partial [Brevinema sp.]